MEYLVVKLWVHVYTKRAVDVIIFLADASSMIFFSFLDFHLSHVHGLRFSLDWRSRSNGFRCQNVDYRSNG